MRVALILALLAGPAGAQTPSYLPYEQDFLACLAATSPTHCAQRAGQACVAAETGGTSSIAMAQCFAMERDLWDIQISRRVTELTHALRAQDSENRAFFGERHSAAAEAFVAAQVLWEAWAAAECRAVYEQWGAGSHRYLAAAQCEVTLAAERLERLSQVLAPVSE